MDDAAYLEVVRRELPIRLRALWEEDVAYFRSSESVTEFRPTRVTVGVATLPEVVGGGRDAVLVHVGAGPGVEDLFAPVGGRFAWTEHR